MMTNSIKASVVEAPVVESNNKQYKIVTPGNIVKNALTGEETDIGFTQVVTKESVQAEIDRLTDELQKSQAKMAAIQKL